MTAPDRIDRICIWLAWIAGLAAYPTVLMMVAQ